MSGRRDDRRRKKIKGKEGVQTRRALFILLTVPLLMGSRNTGSLRENSSRAAVFAEAQSAYADIVAYDEGAKVTTEEIYALYKREDRLSGAKQICEILSGARMALACAFDADAFALQYFYTSAEPAVCPLGVRLAEVVLYPFSAEEATRRDEILLFGGDEGELDALYAPLEAAVLRGEEMGRVPYAPCGALVYLSGSNCFLPDALFAEIGSLSEAGEKTAPVRDARGVLQARLVEKDVCLSKIRDWFSAY